MSQLQPGRRATPTNWVDHATIQYPAFRRNLYTEASDLSRMSEEEVAEFRSQLDDITVRGKDVPRPVKNWFQCGLSGRILDVLKKDGFDKPMPIQVSLSRLSRSDAQGC